MNLRDTKPEHVFHSMEWLAWVVLVVSLGLGMGTSPGNITTPYNDVTRPGLDLVADVLMTAVVVAAALAQIWVQVKYPHRGTILDRFARWLMFCTSTIFAFRFLFQMWKSGDIYAPLITVIAFIAYGMAQIIASLSIASKEMA